MSHDIGIEGLRVPPHSIEAEQAVLGGLLLSNAAFERIGDRLEEADFYRADHRLIWRALLRLIEQSRPADVLTVHDALKSAGQAGDAGGLPYLHQLASGTPSAANVRQYAQIVRDRGLQRRVIQVATWIQEQAYGAGVDAAELLDRAQAQLLGMTAQRGDREPRNMSTVLSRVMEALDARHRGQEPCIPTGLLDLDRLLNGGLRGGRLYVLAGRPSSGKSALALQIGIHAALSRNAVAVSSLEMTDDENGERALAAASKVDLDRVITGRLEPEDWDRLGRGLGELNEAPIFFDDTPAVSLQQLRARARRLRHWHGVRLLIVDYLQLMRADERGESRHLEVMSLAEGLKALAKELDIAVLALSQMNRKCEDRPMPHRRGQIADLRDSGGIDAAADVIAFVYREEMYELDTPAKNIAEIIVRKARQGKTGTVYAVFRGEFARFENAAEGFVPQYTAPPKPRAMAPARKAFTDVD